MIWNFFLNVFCPIVVMLLIIGTMCAVAYCVYKMSKES